MSDERLRALYEQVTRARTDSARVGCPSAEALRQLVDQGGPEERRLAILDHVMSCDACHQEFELLRSVGQGARQDVRRQVPRWMLAAAASVVLLLGGSVVWQAVGPRGTTTFRGGADDVVLVSPVDTDEQGPLRLVWRAVPAATSYRVELLDTSGVVLHGEVTRDTTLVVPASASIGAERDIQWWVRATMPDGSERTGGPARFRLGR